LPKTEHDFYEVYAYDRLEQGSAVKIEHTVYHTNANISGLVRQGKDAVRAMREESAASEQTAYDIVQAALKQWEQQAAVTKLYDHALQYMDTPEVRHTANQWQPNPHNDDWNEISNRVYKMSCRIREDTRYNRDTKQHEPVAWYVTWDVYLNSPKDGHSVHLAGQNQKRYTDKAAAEKYLQGRINAYAHLFTEISPPIPKEHEQRFMVHGCLLPGYTVEGQEPRQAKETVAETPEGGIFTPKPQKPSVLGRLAEAKENTQAAGKAAGKKKEDMER